MSAKHSDNEMHRRAVELIRAAYDIADRMRNVDLAAINKQRPSKLRYHAQHELVREFIERANAMAEFACQLGLIDSNEQREILKAISSEHSELEHWFMGEGTSER